MKGEIEKAITEVLQEMGIETPDFVVEHPSDLTHGDYATNVAMVCAKKLGKSPRELAEQIVIKLKEKIEFKDVDEIRGASEMNEGDVSKYTMTERMSEATKKFATYVDSIEIAGPGFINFHLDRTFFSEKVAEIITNPEKWGKNDLRAGKKIIVEYTDPNPFKEFHVGHLFTNTVGESLARLFMMSGADVKRVNYQGDVGLHVAHALYGMLKLGFTDIDSFSARDLGKAYAFGATAYKESEEAQKEIREINKKVYDRSDETINTLYDAGRKISLAYFDSLYEILDTQFDAFFFESEAGPKGKELVESHPEIFIESNGARIFEGEKYGLHTRVFQNTEGLPTYEAKELALAKMKEDRLGVYDLSIVSTSNEITEYFKVLKKAMSFIYPELEAKTEHIGHGTVRLSTGKMSSRTGDVVSAIDFIDEVADMAMAKMDEGGKIAPEDLLARDIAIGAIKYATLRGNILQDTIFDKEQALSFEGNSGPYLQYTHARIGSVIEKTIAVSLEENCTHVPPVPYELEKYIYQFPEVIEKAQSERAPHHTITFLTELASAFNTFYAQEKIADPTDEFAPYKLALAKAVRTTLKNGLWVLGIKAPDKM